MKKTLEKGTKITHSRTTEYFSYIIHSIETGTPRRVNVNVKNQGLIYNLPYGCVVEVPCLVDETGIHPCHVGKLPPQCAALNKTNINVHELAALAAIEGDKELAFQAILLDPLTSSILTIDETRKMVDEMFTAEADYLPKYN
jgi:alpha-galactosidase